MPFESLPAGRHRWIAVSAVAVAVGCGRASDPARSGEAPLDTVRAERLVTIGEIDGAPEYLFGDVESVAADRAGTVYVADRIGSTVRAYDVAGRFVGTVGAEGQGPGEFNGPHDLTFDPLGRLYVRDRFRVSVFLPREEPGIADSLIRTIPLGGASTDRRRARADGSRYYLPSYFYYMFVNHRYFYLVLDSTGQTGDTVPVRSITNPEIFGRTNYPVRGGALGVPVEGVNLAPFEAAPRWGITSAGNVLVTQGDRYEIVEWNPRGDTVRVIRRETEARTVPAGAARDSARAFRSRLDTIPVPLAEVRGMSDLARSARLPELLPEILAVQVDLDGDIWVRRWPPDQATGQAVFDVFDASGAGLRTVLIHADLQTEPPPWVSSGVVAGVVADPVTGVERVAVFALPG